MEKLNFISYNLMSFNPYKVIPQNSSGSQVRHILIDLFRNEYFKYRLLRKEKFVQWKKLKSLEKI